MIGPRALDGRGFFILLSPEQASVARSRYNTGSDKENAPVQGGKPGRYSGRKVRATTRRKLDITSFFRSDKLNARDSLNRTAVRAADLMVDLFPPLIPAPVLQPEDSSRRFCRFVLFNLD